MKSKKIVAIIYDFDKTLSTKDMQNFDFIGNLGINVDEFWRETTEFKKANNMDATLACLYMMVKKTYDKNQYITKNQLNELGKNVEFFDGIDEWFDRVNKYGEENGLKIEHYIISSGNKEIIEGTKIYKYFKEVYACEYLYDSNGHAVWPKNAVNYTNKTQFIFRINKGVFDINDDFNLNSKMEYSRRRIPFENMIYIGDGYTDIPCMQIVKDNHGTSIGVYSSNKSNVERLYNDERINYLAKADYRKNSEIDKIVYNIIEKISKKSLVNN